MKTSGAKRIAERYVKALFDVAEAASALADVEKDMASLGAALAESAEFAQFLTNPLMDRDQQANVMAALAEKMKASKLTTQFIAMLTRQKRLPILPEIIALFAQTAATARGEMQAEVIAASPLKAPEVAQIKDRLSKAFGKKVNLDVRQDADLLGGVVLKVGSQQLDASLAGKMARLKLALQAA